MSRFNRQTLMEGHPWDIEQMSVLIPRFIERELLGTEEIVRNRRIVFRIWERTFNITNKDFSVIRTGSRADGFIMAVSDDDMMIVDNDVVVLYPGKTVRPDDAHKTVLYVRESDCRPGYVALQLSHLGQKTQHCLVQALVPVGNVIFVSSDMFREQVVNEHTITTGIPHESNGPSSSVKDKKDCVRCFHFGWPHEANQWVTRPRLHGWPRKTLIDEIVQIGCHLVPVGDKCSEDTLLQWRISFALAEKLLVFSFSHIQMKMYYFLKFFLKQMKDTLQDSIGKEDDDILCSYHLKTLMFISVEHSNPKLWQEHCFLHCFWFCFNILIACVRAGHFPNYFIPTINLFQRKVNGQNQQKLFQILSRFHSEKLLCLSHSSRQFCHFNLIEYVYKFEVQTELMRTQTVQEIEYERDMNVKCQLEGTHLPHRDPIHRYIAGSINVQINCLSELDESISFANTVSLVSESAMTEFHQDLITGPTNNKTRYRTLRKCQHRLTLCASMDTYLLPLATLYFLTGNYLKARKMCGQIISLPSYYTDGRDSLPPQLKDMYMEQYCGKGYTFIHKLKKTFAVSVIQIQEAMHLPHLRPEIEKSPNGVAIPPLPYAVFLFFLCSHELNDRIGCDVSLRNLRKVKYDVNQGGHGHWIVHTLLGICYQTLGDYPRAISAYRDSAQTKTEYYPYNPALERIAALQRFATK